VIDDQARALLIVGAILSGASGSAGFVGGRMTAPELAPVAEVRFVHVPVPAPPPVAAIEPAPSAPAEPVAEPAAPAPAVEAPPLPQPRPKIEPKPKTEPPVKKSRTVNRALPSCAVVKREFEAMTWPQRMARYQRATPQEIAHGKRCLGF
jgi:hypothetical protein